MCVKAFEGALLTLMHHGLKISQKESQNLVWDFHDTVHSHISPSGGDFMHLGRIRLGICRRADVD